MAEYAKSNLSVGELDCLATLWANQAVGIPALKLSEIYEQVGRRRLERGETSPAPSTVSNYLRSLTTKGVVREVHIEAVSGESDQNVARGIRGTVPVTRSPRTGYQPSMRPGEVLRPSFLELAEAYPENDRLDAIVDFAAAIGTLTPDSLVALREWLQKLRP